MVKSRNYNGEKREFQMIFERKIEIKLEQPQNK